jgi:hypothetical protein
MVYGQPSDAYELFNVTFAESKWKTPCRSGFKLHVTVSTEHHDTLARAVLPSLLSLPAHHKVVITWQYAAFNAGDQAGKFITIYAGPAAAANPIVDRIDPILIGLCRQGVRPGPRPMSRQANHKEPEIPIGRSGMITCLWLDDLLHGRPGAAAQGWRSGGRRSSLDAAGSRRNNVGMGKILILILVLVAAVVGWRWWQGVEAARLNRLNRSRPPAQPRDDRAPPASSGKPVDDMRRCPVCDDYVSINARRCDRPTCPRG